MSPKELVLKNYNLNQPKTQLAKFEWSKIIEDKNLYQTKNPRITR